MKGRAAARQHNSLPTADEIPDPPPEMQQPAAIVGDQAAIGAFGSVSASTLFPAQLFDPNNVAKVLA